MIVFVLAQCCSGSTEKSLSSFPGHKIAQLSELVCERVLLNSHHLDFTRIFLNPIEVQLVNCLFFLALVKSSTRKDKVYGGQLLTWGVHRVLSYWNGVIPWEVNSPNPSSKRRSPKVLKYCTTTSTFHPSLFFFFPKHCLCDDEDWKLKLPPPLHYFSWYGTDKE